MRAQNQRMIVLGLLSIGLRYGWQMEKFAADTNMRQWTPIGMSTIYKILKDLARDGAVDAHKEVGGKGPARTAYTLTQLGLDEFSMAMGKALRSPQPVYSDRMAGLVFLPTLAAPDSLQLIADCDTGLADADDQLAGSLRENPDDVIADAVIGFYRDVCAAERKALAKVRAKIETLAPPGAVRHKGR